MVLTPILRSSIRTPLIFPCPTPGPQLSKETFCRREQLLKTTIRFRTIVSAIEDGNLKADFCAKPALRGIHNSMHWGLRILTGLEQIQRLKEHTAETAQIAYQCMKFRIVARREMLGVLEGRIQVELKPNLNDPIHSIFDIEGIVIEADLARGNHVTQILFARKSICQA
jgi:hypothetical protein